ncbi:alpha/beta hydrolase [Flavobacterium microcysteis]|jgi:pimeloyl-ACP methyl ester carboxylesterase|uniref:Alpha/beta hydrolase n=1 Tax=Flavobacterium microcysteis TaxID=2596891 RepID=A0A501QDJ4_9FLAO|nr:alpha/beta hydrolase [Flavobacterium microcysteis]TPD70472.1 alpha/beta hydrolase [Flavobacterium microcysteis]
MENKNVTIILVHGAWGDGSHWRHVIENLHNEGYSVRSVQNPLTSLADDIQKTKDLIDMQPGKVLLVGHSYGGAVISGAGHHDKVAGLVYIAAFAPDKGESLGGIFARREQPSGAANIYPDEKGFLWVKYDKFHESFAQDLNKEDSIVMSLSQKPIHGSIFGTEVGEPAWKTKPSWYQVSDKDHMIPPATQKEMAERMNPKKIIHLDASHASLAVRPKEISELIKEAVATIS